MIVDSLTTSAGHAGRPNEDFVGAVPGAVVLLDGAGIPGSESLCSHGVAWYTHSLGGALLGRLSRDDAPDLAAILAGAIGEIADRHRDKCDIANPNSPQATVAIVRAGGGGRNTTGSSRPARPGCGHGATGRAATGSPRTARGQRRKR